MQKKTQISILLVQVYHTGAPDHQGRLSCIQFYKVEQDNDIRGNGMLHIVVRMIQYL